MPIGSFLSFSSAPGLWLALGLSALTALVVVVRRPGMPTLSYLAAGIGVVLLAFAAGELTWERDAAHPVAVMVDLSPSTRTAEYRDRAVLQRRIRELLGDAPYRVEFFASQVVSVESSGQRLSDIPVDQTMYASPAAAAVLLFSDCRFALPERAPPTYAVIDPGLEDVEDAAITDLVVRGGEVTATVRNGGSTRQLVVRNGTASSPTTVPSGNIVVSRPLEGHDDRVSAELSPGDAWPENDALAAAIPIPRQAERWWVGRSEPPREWRALSAAELPVEASAYLAPAVIALDNVPASDLTEAQQRLLRQYVRDLGGGLVILGGDRAFAVGGYQGTQLDVLSPLASNPPQPTTHWVLLLDASGSMSARAAGATRWSLVTDAASQLLPYLPPQDVVSIGSFAEKLDWWVQAQPVRDATSVPLPPPGRYPHGPTNLQPALEAIARSVNARMPVQLLVLSDFDTQVTRAGELAALLKERSVRLNLLAIGEGTALPVLREVSSSTGGTILTQLDPRMWTSAMRQLARAAGAKLLEHEQVTATFTGEASAVPPQTAGTWNRVWVKESATRLAEARRGPDVLPMAAKWNVGEGQVLAGAFGVPSQHVQRLADLVARPPRDPRFHVTWRSNSELTVTVDASSDGDYLNDRLVTLELADGSNTGQRPIPQVGPGRYELTMPAPRSAGVATVRAEGRAIDRIALASRYAPEFDALGNDHAAMKELARRSGGRVIAPDISRPLEIHWPRRAMPLTSILACAGALFVALGLVWWRLH